MLRIFIISLMTSLALITGQSPAQALNDLDKLGIAGAVKSITETKYLLNGPAGDSATNRIISRKRVSYNENGFENEVITYESGSVSSTAVCHFDTEGKPDFVKVFDPDGTIKYTVSYKYNDKGFRTEAEFHWKDQQFYDEYKEKTENYFELFERNVYSRIIYTNDYRGFFTEEKYLRDDSSISYHYTHRYDIHGNKLVMSYFNSSGRTSWLTKYKYNRANIMTESRVYKSNRIAVTSKYSYQFDERGNWTSRLEKREVVDNVLTQFFQRGDFLTERVIEYYEL